MSTVVASLTAEYHRYKALAEAAIAQVSDAELSHAPAADSNSIAVIVRHVAGNLTSRFTDFRTADGEKPWRNRDGEFEERAASRDELLASWHTGWETLFAALRALTDENLEEEIAIRGQRLPIHDALHRSLAHTAYHVGQIVYLAKSIRGTAWKTLSIPRGGSAAANRNTALQDPAQR